MEQTNDVKELQEEIDRLVDYNRHLSEANNLRYQLSLAANRVLDDLWEWRWMIVLILVELTRLWVEVDHRQISEEMNRHVHGIELQFQNMIGLPRTPREGESEVSPGHRMISRLNGRWCDFRLAGGVLSPLPRYTAVIQSAGAWVVVSESLAGRIQGGSIHADSGGQPVGHKDWNDQLKARPLSLLPYRPQVPSVA